MKENDLGQELKICRHCNEKHIRGYQKDVDL